MIKPGDLRLNNVLKIGNDIATVKGVSYDNFIQYTVSGNNVIRVYGEPVEEFEPIPLTEKWLKDFGFDYDQDNSDNYYDIQITKELFLSINLDTHNALIGKGYDWTNAIAKVRHLHQLQNLYFALTSMELTKQ